jgi:hypothetical protein
VSRAVCERETRNAERTTANAQRATPTTRLAASHIAATKLSRSSAAALTLAPNRAHQRAASRL